MSRAKLDISPSLVALASNPWGKAFESVGGSLVTLGQQKVDEAKEKAAKQEADAKERARQMAQAEQNRVLNPEATNRFYKNRGIDPKGPLASPDAPTKANASLGLMDLGAQAEPEKPTKLSEFVNDRDEQIIVMSDGSRVNAGKVKADTKEPKAPTSRTYWNPKTNQNEIEEWYPDRGWVATGKPAWKNQPNGGANSAIDGMMKVQGVGSPGLKWLHEQGYLIGLGDGKGYLAPKEEIEKAKQISQAGTIEVN